MIAANKVDWPAIGSDHNGTPELKARLQGAIARMPWVNARDGMTIGAMAADGLTESIKVFRIPRVSHISWESADLAPFGLLGIRGHYMNGVKDVVLLHEGSVVTPVAVVHRRDLDA